jgi:hypothetical protein
MERLKNKYTGQTCYIVGKGISSQYLTKEHFGDGVIITLNNAIHKVESLNLPNDTYSMQKDGHGYGTRVCPCIKDKSNLENCFMTYPQSATLLIHELEGSDCMKEYTPRIVFNNNTLGLHWSNVSAITAMKIAEVMGCSSLKLLCFDSVTHGDSQYYIHGKGIASGPNYMVQVQNTINFAKQYTHEFITPK